MDNRLKEFDKLLLDNAFLKVQNHALVDKNPKWKNGGKLYRRLQKNRSKIVWKLLIQMKKPT